MSKKQNQYTNKRSSNLINTAKEHYRSEFCRYLVACHRIRRPDVSLQFSRKVTVPMPYVMVDSNMLHSLHSNIGPAKAI